MLMIATSNFWAYGSSNKKACKKPNFSEFTPVNNAQIATKSAFSVITSSNTNPESIIVTIKDQPIAVTITPKNQGFQVSGTLPDTIKGGFARINITADGPNQRKGNTAWLVKIIE